MMQITNSHPKLYIETYGCQMNVNDSEIVVSLMQKHGYGITKEPISADVIFINTCAIRDNAEQRVRGRLGFFKQIKSEKPSLLIAVIGCMAERLKEKLLEEEKIVDIIVGPDAYRDLPKLVGDASTGQKAVNVLLSREETYADINPVRYASNGVSAFVSITRGCDNMCSFCVVPFTRGRERSRDPKSIIKEIEQLLVKGYKEVTLLGQNVDKYNWNGSMKFANLLKEVATLSPQLRVRFSTSYPQDMTDEVLYSITKYDNICDYIHLPAQSGSNFMLERMRRGYTKEWYLKRIKKIREIIPNCGISSDFIIGFCGETAKEHQDTLLLMQEVHFDFSYMFKYSERPNTYAQRKFEDNVPEEIKQQRLTEVINLQNRLSKESNKKDVNKTFEVLIEGVSKKSENEFVGRNSQNKSIVFPKKDHKIGDYVKVKVIGCTQATLRGVV